jgi:hypothetical protein
MNTITGFRPFDSRFSKILSPRSVDLVGGITPPILAPALEAINQIPLKGSDFAFRTDITETPRSRGVPLTLGIE